MTSVVTNSDRSRFRLLRLALTRGHRYRRYRLATMALSMVALFAVPLLGLARVDLWGGDHRLLFRVVSLPGGVGAVAAGVVGFYVVTFLVNMIAGRMFCGFGCPMGQLSRFGDAVDVFANEPDHRRAAWRNLWAFAVLLGLAATVWAVSPRVFLSGQVASLATTLGAILVLSAAGVFHARRIRWSFCRKACPIGLYYSAVQTGGLVKVRYDSNAVCTDCGACASICPVHLDPRHLEQTVPSPGGLGFADLPADAHCLRCGTCVEICEHMTRKHVGDPAMAFRRATSSAARPIRPQPMPLEDGADWFDASGGMVEPGFEADPDGRVRTAVKSGANDRASHLEA